MVKTKSETRRLIQQGAVRVDGQRIADIHYNITPTRKNLVIQVGPRRVMAFAFFPEKDFAGGVDCA
jgi:tyrosyl-tRNA synthetase